MQAVFFFPLALCLCMDSPKDTIYSLQGRVTRTVTLNSPKPKCMTQASEISERDLGQGT